MTMSAKESSSFPMPEEAFSILAANPSKKSKTAPSIIRMKPWSGRPPKVKITPTTPQRRFMEVIESGMCFLIFI